MRFTPRIWLDRERVDAEDLNDLEARVQAGVNALVEGVPGGVTTVVEVEPGVYEITSEAG